jgi:MFS family permease
MLLDAVEVSVVLVALPTIGEALDLPLLAVQCLMSGFALGFAAALLLGGPLTARWGRRRTYLAAMAVFAAASVIGGVTDSGALLVATRVVKGGCAGLTAPSGLAIISTAFREGPEQRRALSVYSMFGATGFTAGLLLSAALLTSSWSWTFLFPAPVALVLLVFAARLIPGTHGSGAPAGRRSASLLRNGGLRRAATGAATLNGTYAALLLLVTFELQQRLDWPPWQCAFALLPACLPLVAAVPFAGRMTARWGTGRLVVLGAFAAFLGCAYYAWRASDPSYWTAVLPALTLMETGFVLSFAALNMQATAAVPPVERGRAVPLYQTAVQLGGVLMLPLTALLLTVGQGVRPALLLITSVSAVGLLATLTGLRCASSGGAAPPLHSERVPRK